MKKSMQKKHDKLNNELDKLERQVCDTCESPFYSNREYETMCPVCYKLDKNYKILKSDKQCRCLQDELSDCYEALDEIEERLEKIQKETRRYRREALKLSKQNNSKSIDRSMLRKMLRLCHPDHQQNSKKKEVAQEVTRWLLEQESDSK